MAGGSANLKAKTGITIAPNKRGPIAKRNRMVQGLLHVSPQ